MMPISKRVVSLAFGKNSWLKHLPHRGALNRFVQNHNSCIELEANGDKSVSNIRIKPQEVLPQADSEIGKDMVGVIRRLDVLKIVQKFLNKDELFDVVNNLGVDENMLKIVKESFQNYCSQTQNLPLNLYIILYDVIKGKRHVLDLLPYFTQHIYHVYPHLQYLKELRNIGDLQNPAQWYFLARSMKRKLIFHYGPTNSGKTHHALKKFMEAKRSIYCAPLKLLAHEIYEKANANGIKCNLLTGDDKKKVLPEGSLDYHVSCTIEMADTTVKYDVAVIDEIQMLQCPVRGYSWTRALLGLAAEEIHLCGEASALNYLKEQAELLNEEFECISYKRLTRLYVEKEAVKNFQNITNGDCIVCFSRKDIISICLRLDSLQIKFAVIYGTLPPATKNLQSRYFNNPETCCKVLVATDAVGLGVNLNIRRIIFYSLHKRNNLISVSQALQIAGRAGRYNSKYLKGYVTTFFEKDLDILKHLLLSTPEKVKQAGLFPTSEQIETFSYFLPKLNFTDLLDVFISLATLNDLYFMCDVTTFKGLANRINHINMNVKHKYTFCIAPVNYKSPMSIALFIQFAAKFSKNEVISYSFMKNFLKWPPPADSNNLSQLEVLEDLFDCLDLYLWFGNRMEKNFPDKNNIKLMQTELEAVISKSVTRIVNMAKADMKRTNLNSEDKNCKNELMAGMILDQMNVNLNEKLTKKRNKNDLKKP